MLSRRELLRNLGRGYVGMAIAPLVGDLRSPGRSVRCVNIVNFIRGVEPRFKIDLMLSVRNQMGRIREHGLPATWLLQFDALVSGDFVGFLKDQMTKSHEVGAWFEMNELHCRAAGVQWRGRPGFEWDYHPSVAFTLGYTKDERQKLADIAMSEFKRVWGKYPSSVGSWNLDSFTVEYLTDRYSVDAFAVCRDQIATDGFTIWGSPIAGYYPSRQNSWAPALDRRNQISSPIFRMLGQDPVYYYDGDWKVPPGKRMRPPDTMEPVWASGQNPTFVREFFDMIEKAPTLGFAYAQIGQENSFPWDEQQHGYPAQMDAVAELRNRRIVHVETMGESGRRFKRAFRETPAQAQVMLSDPFGNADPPARTIWYQSKFYRANLHLRGDELYLRDLFVYSDRFKQPFLDELTRLNDVEQRMPAVLDGYHWSGKHGFDELPGAGGFFSANERRLTLSGMPKVDEAGANLTAALTLLDRSSLHVRFADRMISFELGRPFELEFVWDPSRSALVSVEPGQANFRWQGFEYAVRVPLGRAQATSSGWKVAATDGKISLVLAQDS